MSSGGVGESFEECVVDVAAAGLSLEVGVVALALEQRLGKVVMRSPGG